ncbi:MAG: DUF4349 domain-containing protein [Hyphomonadaceae bacterium]
MRRIAAGLLLAALLMGCGQANVANTAPAEAPMASGGMVEAERAIAGEESFAADNAAAPAPPPPPQAETTPDQAPAQAAGPAPVLFLAYSYAMGLELPSQRLSGVMDMHTNACQAAGVRQCQLIGSNVSGDPESYIEGYVSLRAAPEWLRTFRAGMTAQVDAAGGRIVSETTNTEDLTRQIVDTEARLRAQTALRDRLQELLRSRPGRLSDLLEVERELARVQGEIDAVQSNLAVMRTRVAMSELTIQYRSAPRSVGSDTFQPLRQAFADFLGIVVGGFAVIVRIIAGLVPLLVVIIPIGWLLLRWRRARGGRFFGRRRPAESDASAS